jgi:putative SOS response-associated peptidase YedK
VAGITPLRSGKEAAVIPDYNLCPTSYVPVVKQGANPSERELKFMKWSLEPRFFPSQPLTTINARVESIKTSRVFSPLIESNRCVVIVDAFYEWNQSRGDHIPYLIRFTDDVREEPIELSVEISEETPLNSITGDNLHDEEPEPGCILPRGVSPLLFAGLYDVSKTTGENTCTILTTESHGKVSAIHARMPLLLSPKTAQEWLDCKNHTFDDVIPRVKKACRSLSEKLTCIEVSSLVNTISNKSIDVTLPVKEWKKRSFEKGLGRFFSTSPSKKAKIGGTCNGSATGKES